MKLIKVIATLSILLVSSYANAGLIMDENFDPITSSNWSILGGTTLGAPSAEFYDQNALIFNGSGTRSATTIAFDMTSGGMLSFLLKIGGPNDTSTFEDADGGEDVLIEFSLDGSSWSQLQLIDTEDSNYRDTWGLVSLDFTGLVLGATTQFRWTQVTHSGTTYDNWAIDNVKLSNNVAVPEPSTLAIFSLGIFALAARRFKK